MWEEGLRLFSYDTRIEGWTFGAIISGATIVTIVYYVLRSPQKNMPDFLRFVLAEYTIVVLLVTVFLRKSLALPEGYRQSLFGNKSVIIENPFKELLANVLLFIPIGFLLHIVLRRFKLKFTLLIGGAFSFMIEFLQFAFHKGIADINDVICNSIGLIIGVEFCALMKT